MPALEAAMVDAAETAEMAEWPREAGRGDGSADDDLSSSSLLDLICAAVASSCKLSLPGQVPARVIRAGGWWWWWRWW